MQQISGVSLHLTNRLLISRSSQQSVEHAATDGYNAKITGSTTGMVQAMRFTAKMQSVRPEDGFG